MSRLRNLAEAATPGPWPADGERVLTYVGEAYPVGRVARCGRQADAAFIAACSPEVIVAYENLKDAAGRVAVLEYHPEMSQAENDELRRRAETFRAALALVETLTKEERDG